VLNLHMRSVATFLKQWKVFEFHEKRNQTLVKGTGVLQ
jgi:hypothetical protein